MRYFVLLFVYFLGLNTSFAQDSSLYPARKENKWGYINFKGEFKIPSQYDNAFSFFSGKLAGVSKNKKLGFINSENEIIVPMIFDNISYYGDYYVGSVEDSCFTLFDNKGNIIESYCESCEDCILGYRVLYNKRVSKEIDDGVHEIFDIENIEERHTVNASWVYLYKYCYLIVDKDNKYVMFDYTGKKLVDDNYETLYIINSDENSQVFFYRKSNYNSGYIYITDSDIQIKPSAEDIYSHRMGSECEYIIILMNNGDYQLITKDGDTIINASPFTLDIKKIPTDPSILCGQELILSRQQNGMFQIVTFENEKFIDGEFRSVFSLVKNKYIALETTNKWKIYDVVNKIFVSQEFDYLNQFVRDLASFKLKNEEGILKQGYINKDLEIVYLEE